MILLLAILITLGFDQSIESLESLMTPSPDFKMIYCLIWLLFVHVIADFVLQRHEISINKHNNLIYLCTHAFEYAMILLIGASLLVLIQPRHFVDIMISRLYVFVAVNAITHLMIDFCTSKLCHMFYAKQDLHNHYVVIGFDQFLHQSIIIITASTLFYL